MMLRCDCGDSECPSCGPAQGTMGYDEEGKMYATPTVGYVFRWDDATRQFKRFLVFRKVAIPRVKLDSYKWSDDYEHPGRTR